eukprot:COSAG01_NODE_19002_length_1038_cov_1.072417_1_plen_79_part_00
MKARRRRREGTRGRGLYPSVHTNNNNNSSKYSERVRSPLSQSVCSHSVVIRHRLQPVRAISGSLPSSGAARGFGVTAL